MYVDKTTVHLTATIIVCILCFIQKSRVIYVFQDSVTDIYVR